MATAQAVRLARLPEGKRRVPALTGAELDAVPTVSRGGDRRPVLAVAGLRHVVELELATVEEVRAVAARDGVRGLEADRTRPELSRLVVIAHPAEGAHGG